MTMTYHQISVEKPPYRPWGRYVCNCRVTECHLFDNLQEAMQFARSWERNCNVGWLAPVLDSGNRQPTVMEARQQVASSIPSTKYFDHRKAKRGPGFLDAPRFLT